MPAFDQLILKTDRLILRPLQESDSGALMEIYSDPKVMRYWSTTPWESIEQAHEMIAREVKGMAAGEQLTLGLERTHDGALIGTCTLFAISAQCRRAEVGYAMAQHAWGKAFMDEALRALLNYGFTELKLNRIEADIDPRNEASKKTLERLGFSREGYLRERWIVGDEISDTALYGLLHRDWRRVLS